MIYVEVVKTVSKLDTFKGCHDRGIIYIGSLFADHRHFVIRCLISFRAFMTDYVKLDLKILIASKLYPYSYDVNSVVTDLNIDNSQDFFRVFVVISESIEVVVNFITVSSKISYLDL